MTTMEITLVDTRETESGTARSAAKRLYQERIGSRDDPSSLSWLNQLLKYGMLDLRHIENPMYLTLLDGKMSPAAFESFLRPYYWGSSQGFNKKVLPAALKAHTNDNWRAYIKSIIREENTPSCHSTMFSNFVQSLGYDVGERTDTAQRFVEKLIVGYSATLGFALGYALGVETEADFQIAVIHSALVRQFPNVVAQDEFFTIHMEESGEEAHAKATCESIEILIANCTIDASQVKDGFNASIIDTREFVCDIYAELAS
ncbi:hypothetical protein GIW45_02265 [Pseudomonas congelans]|uniref:hypothetical protein n=1 Tax=Pseudomonas congelans TaxID=200452 RepID=UPI001F2D0F40|nr:hypothetical protein [Pseudomonas congelans]MCF5162947.1 hypothetical protein [Pseudomonas congelans]